jgi:hypothetical protein
MSRAFGAYINEAGGEQVAPIILLRVLDMPERSNPAETHSCYFTDAEEPISFFDEGGAQEAYLPIGMKIEEVGADQTHEIKSFRVHVDNVSRDFCALVSLVDMMGCEVHVLRAFRDSLEYPECAQMIVAGRVNAWQVSESEIEIECIIPISLEQRVPRRLFWPLCGWDFGGSACGYWGTPSTTDLSSSANAISGGDNGSYPKGNAFDNNESSYWSSSQTGASVQGSAYIGQSNLTGKVRKIRIKTYSSTYNNVAKITVQYRNSGGSWTDILTWQLSTTASTWNEILLPAYDASGTYELRILANAALSPTYAWRIFEVEFLENGTVETSCDHTLATCTAYGNNARFCGFPHLLKSRDPRVLWTKA